MAMPHAATTVPKLHIEALQTIPPFKVTEPRLTRKVLVPDNHNPLAGSGSDSDKFRGCLHVVFYYNKARDVDSDGWHVAGLIKESLGRALNEQPFLAGRLRRQEEGDGDFEIVSNDSGVRLVEAKMDASLKDFLDLKGRMKEDGEAELVFWKEIDAQYPEFSPLFYVQVTNFECGGYSVGISCSLLLADNVITTKFLKNWSDIHEQVLSKNELPKQPIFYLPNIKTTGSSPTIPISSSLCQSRGQTMIFKASSGENLSSEENEIFKSLALLCVEEAEHNLDRKMAFGFSFFVKETQETMRVENCSKGATNGSNGMSPSSLSHGSWENLGAHEVAFIKGSNPTHVSYWIGSISDGVVMAIPSDDKGSCVLNIIVTIVDEN